MAGREKMGGYLQDRRWMARTLDCTYAQSNRLAEWGYPYPVEDGGKSQRNSLQGPEYMRLMRNRTRAAGATILDHSPALEDSCGGTHAIFFADRMRQPRAACGARMQSDFSFEGKNRSRKYHAQFGVRRRILHLGCKVFWSCQCL